MKRLTRKTIKALMKDREKIDNEFGREVISQYFAMQNEDVSCLTEEQQAEKMTKAIYNIGLSTVRLLNDVYDELLDDLKKEQEEAENAEEEENV